MKSLALSAHVSPWTIHFRVLGKSPLPQEGGLEGIPLLATHLAQPSHFTEGETGWRGKDGISGITASWWSSWNQISACCISLFFFLMNHVASRK